MASPLRLEHPLQSFRELNLTQSVSDGDDLDLTGNEFEEAVCMRWE